MFRRRGVLVVVAATLVATAPAAAQPLPDDPPSPAADPVRVLVEVDVAPGASRAAIVEGLGVDGIEVIDEFATSDYVVAEVPADEVDDLAARPGVTDLVVDQVATRALDGSVPLINAPDQWAQGFTGTGTTVVVIDDGVAGGHPNLTGKVQAEACFAWPSGCGGSASATGAGTGQPCPGCSHGTHVAGIAAGAGGGRDGVATGADVFSIRVFASAAGSAFFSDITLALEDVLARAGDFDLAAVNLSVQGSDTFANRCDGEFPPLTEAIHALADRGVPVVAASGNRSSATGMTLPACISDVISVGSHSNDLVVAASSDASAFTSILAPGVGIVSPHPPTSFTSVDGTSFAAPHVAGALAIWLERFPGINHSEALFLSTAHGRRILDTRNGRTYPRLFLDDPADVLIAGTFAPSPEAVGGTYQPLVGDFDGSGTDDVFWYAPGPAVDYVWSSTERSGFAARAEAVGGTYRVVVVDLNGDRRDDVLFHGPGPVLDSLWLGRADGRFDKTTLSISGDHELLVGDFTGDGIDDVFLYSSGPAPDGLIRGGIAPAIEPLGVSGSYDPLVGDFDGDQAADIFWYAAGSAPDFVWYGGAGPTTFTSMSRSVGGTYRPFVGDFGGDGRDDIFWYAPGGTPDYVWRGDATRGPFVSSATSVGGSYRPMPVDATVSPGDEILWYGTAGPDHFWTFAGATRTSVPVPAGDGGEPLAGSFDRLGGADLFFYRPGAAPEATWYAIAA